MNSINKQELKDRTDFLMESLINNPDDSKLFEELCYRIKPISLYFMRCLTKIVPDLDYDDYLQESYLTAWKVLATLSKKEEPVRNPQAYLIAAIKYTYYGVFRTYVMRHQIFSYSYIDSEGNVIQRELDFSAYREKVKQADKRYRSTPQAKLRIKYYRNRYYQQHKQEILKRVSVYTEANKEKVKRYKHQYYMDHREDTLARVREYALTHKEEIKTAIADYRKRNREHINACHDKWKESHKEQYQASQKAYVERNKDAIRAKGRERYYKNKQKKKNLLASIGLEEK